MSERMWAAALSYRVGTGLAAVGASTTVGAMASIGRDSIGWPGLTLMAIASVAVVVRGASMPPTRRSFGQVSREALTLAALGVASIGALVGLGFTLEVAVSMATGGSANRLGLGAIAVIVLVLVMLGSWLLSLGRPRFDEVTDGLVYRIDDFGRRKLDEVRIRLDDLTGRLMEAVRARRSGGIATSVIAAIEGQAEVIRRSVASLESLSHALRELPGEVPVAAGLSGGGETGVREGGGDEIRGPSAFLFAVIVPLTAVMMAVNVFIMMEFFSAVLPSSPILPDPRPLIEAGDVLSVLAAVLAVGAGITIRSLQRGKGRTTPLHLAPWLMITVLSLLQAGAFAMLSVRIDMPESLGMNAQGGLLYASVLYFLAPLGFGITWLLGALGHSLAEQLDRVFAGRSRRRALRMVGRWDRLSEDLDRLSRRAADALDEVGSKSRQALYGQDTVDGLKYLETRITHQESAARAWGSVLLDLVFVGGVVLLGLATYESGLFLASAWLSPSQGAVVQLVAFGFSLVAVTLGLFLKHHFSGVLGVAPGVESVIWAVQLILVALAGSAVMLYLGLGAVVRLTLFLVTALVRLGAWPGDVARRARHRP